MQSCHTSLQEKLTKQQLLKERRKKKHYPQDNHLARRTELLLKC
jgi:hypothetical protein